METVVEGTTSLSLTREPSDSIENKVGKTSSELKVEVKSNGDVPTGVQETDENKGIESKTVEEDWLDILGSGQLRKKVLKKAENSFRPHNSYICEVNIEGKLEDGSVVDKYEKLKLQLGDAEVIQGLDFALPLMEVGEESLVEIYPRFAYGVLGKEPNVPPNSKIVYRVELLSAEPEPDLEDIPAAGRKHVGNRKRERGNWWYSRQEYTLAIQCYRRALEYLDDTQGGMTHDKQPANETSDEELCSLFDDRLKVFNNLAAAQMKIRAYDTALQSVENVLRCQPKNVKALFRKGKILAAKGDNSAAVAVLRDASQLEPDNKTVKQELLRLVSLKNEDTRNERNLYKKMLGQKKLTDSEGKKSSKMYQIRWGIVFGSVAAVVAGMVAYRYKFF